jgi:hypothetical protein
MPNVNTDLMGMSNMNYFNHPAGGQLHGGWGIPSQMAGMMALPHGMMMGPADFHTSFAGMTGVHSNMMMPFHFHANMGVWMGAGGHHLDLAGNVGGSEAGNDHRNRLGVGHGHHLQHRVHMMHQNHHRNFQQHPHGYPPPPFGSNPYGAPHY